MKTMKLTAFLLLFSFALAGCEQQGPFEEAGENIDEAAEDVGEAVEDACEEATDDDC